MEPATFRLVLPRSLFCLFFKSSQVLQQLTIVVTPDLLINSDNLIKKASTQLGDRGGTVVKVLRYKSEGRWFDASWCHWNFSLT